MVILLLSAFVPWLLARTVRDDPTARWMVWLGLLPTSLILLYYSERHPASTWLLTLAGCLSLLLFVRDIRDSKPTSDSKGSLRGTLLVSTILFAPLAYLAWSVDGWLRFGWHNLLQAEAIYSVLLNNANDLGYSSHRLGYPYIGLLPLGLLSRTFDVVPTRPLLAFNFLALVLWVYSIYSFLAERPSSRPLTRAVGILSTVLLSGLTYYVADKGLHLLGLGNVNLEFRASPVTTKFIHLDAMTWGIASLSMQYCILNARRWSSVTTRDVLAFLFGAQTILTYPLLGPCAILVAAVHALDLNGRGRPVLRFSRAVNPAALSGVLGAILLLYGADKGTSTVAIASSLSDIAFQIFNGTAVVSFVAMLAIVGLLSEERVLQLRVAMLWAAFAGAFVILRLPLDVQYKFLYGILIVLLFHASTAVAVHFDAAAKLAGKFGTAGAISAMAIAYVFYSLQLAQHLPPLRNRLALVEDSWLLESKSSLAIKRGLEQLHVPLTVTTLIADSPEPLVPFLRIPQFFYAGRAQVGYSMSYEMINTQVKAYSSEEYAQRKSISARVLEGCDVDAFPARTESSEVFLLAVRADSACKTTFERSTRLARVATLDDGGEVFVQQAAAH